MTTKGNKNYLDLIKELVQLIKENNLSEIELEHSDKDSESVYVRVSRQNDVPLPQVSKLQSASTALSTQNENAENAENVEESLKTPTIENDPGTLLSPMVGTVYLAPEPNSSPFVQVGDKVKVGQTILIVEAMKTLNQIPAVKNGIIKRILVEDGMPVEYGSPLAVIE
jgi:acetyl-CoA carboxylase biotin carboxyl carrier protein